LPSESPSGQPLTTEQPNNPTTLFSGRESATTQQLNNPATDRLRTTKQPINLTTDAEGCIVHVNMPLSCYRQCAGSLSMDDRKFLPQVLRVLNKAFGPGGALAQFQYLREVALSRQYWGASWMAFSRGGRLAAVRLWWLSWRFNRLAPVPVERPWFRMLIRYCCLPRPGMDRG